MLTWKGDRFVVGETTFQSAPPEFFAEGAHLDVKEGDFFIFKSRSLVERYLALIDELKPQHIFELGIMAGGSTLFFAEAGRPRRVIAIDREPMPRILKRVESYAAGRGLGDVVRAFGGVDQADRKRLAEIVEETLDGAALDLVVDDCSHVYEPTHASFNELFPRIRPGGAYVIEDWPWQAQVPVTRLLFEIVLAIPAIPGLITEISIQRGAAVIRRGDATVDPASFEISACSNSSGQGLLAPVQAAATDELD